MSNPLLKIILGILAIGIIFLVGIEYNSTVREINELNKKIADSETILRELKERKVFYIIDKGDGNLLSYQIVPAENSTVFSLLKGLAQRENFVIEYKTYEGMGVFVESIAGLKGGADNKWWQYWVNGELPQVSADKYRVKSGDRVEWKFTPSSF
jgi:hypothetical protein